MAWKWDTILYDRDGWMASVGRNFQRLGDGSVAIRISASDEQGYVNDVYHEFSEKFVLRTADGGISWQRYDGPIPEGNELHLGNGILLGVYSGGSVSLDEKRKLLHKATRAVRRARGRGASGVWTLQYAGLCVEGRT